MPSDPTAKETLRPDLERGTSRFTPTFVGSRSRRTAGLLAALLLLAPRGARAEGDAPAADPVEPADPSITYVSAGGIVPSGLPVDPLASLYLWRAPASGESRLRAQISVIANEVRWDRRVTPGQGWQTVLALDSTTLPWEQAEVVGGREYRPGELKWYQALSLIHI